MNFHSVVLPTPCTWAKLSMIISSRLRHSPVIAALQQRLVSVEVSQCALPVDIIDAISKTKVSRTQCQKATTKLHLIPQYIILTDFDISTFLNGESLLQTFETHATAMPTHGRLIVLALCSDLNVEKLQAAVWQLHSSVTKCRLSQIVIIPVDSFDEGKQSLNYLVVELLCLRSWSTAEKDPVCQWQQKMRWRWK